MFRLVIFSCMFLITFAASESRTKVTDGKIVGGHDTDITDVPYQVSVRHNGNYWCGGSIIGSQYILTAAHCVQNKDPNLLSIRAGSSYRNKDGQVIKVDKVITHPNYDADNVNYDAAVLVLKESLRADEGVQIVSLANVEPKEGDMVLISGWGSLGEDKDAANFLQSVSVPVVSKTTCNQMYGYENAIMDQMFCAGHPNGGKDSCDGDSGGPAVINGKLAGIVSWGEDCGDEKKPGVYTNIPKILDWILAQIR